MKEYQQKMAQLEHKEIHFPSVYFNNLLKVLRILNEMAIALDIGEQGGVIGLRLSTNDDPIYLFPGMSRSEWVIKWVYCHFLHNTKSYFCVAKNRVNGFQRRNSATFVLVWVSSGNRKIATSANTIYLIARTNITVFCFNWLYRSEWIRRWLSSTTPYLAIHLRSFSESSNTFSRTLNLWFPIMDRKSEVIKSS